MRLACEVRSSGEHPLERISDGLLASGDIAGRQGQHGVGLIAGHQALDIAGVSPLNDESAESSGRRAGSR